MHIFWFVFVPLKTLNSSQDIQTVSVECVEWFTQYQSKKEWKIPVKAPIKINIWHRIHTNQTANADCDIKAWLYQRFGFGLVRQFPIHIPYEYRQKSETELLRLI